MTNSYNLSQKQLPKIIFIHGLNNNSEAFVPMKNYYENLGFKCIAMTLPGHGIVRDESKDFKTAFRFFDQELSKLISSPYMIVAFSQGALFFQLWLEKNSAPKPLAQILLAPALIIRRQSFIKNLMRFLPSFLPVPSGSPRRLRRYSALLVREYQTLIDGLETYQNLKNQFRVPTLILIDPKDELVAAQEIETQVQNGIQKNVTFEYFRRNQLKDNIGHHHILFHPDYFDDLQWTFFNDRILRFMNSIID